MIRAIARVNLTNVFASLRAIKECHTVYYNASLLLILTLHVNG